MRAIDLTENVRGKNVGDESFWPVYARAEELGRPLFLKNVDTISERLIDEEYSMMNILSNPFEATIAATSLRLSGALETSSRSSRSIFHTLAGSSHLSTRGSRSPKKHGQS